MEGCRSTYVNTPEFFDGVEGDDFFQQIVPVVTLTSVSMCFVGTAVVIYE